MNSLKQKAVSLLVDVWQNGDYAKLPLICQPNVKRHHERIPANGIDEYCKVVGFYRQAFSDLRYEIREIIAEGNKVAVVYMVTGTHTGPMGNIPATGVRDTIGCFDFYIFSDGLMSEIFTEFDELGLLIKLGVMKA